MVKIIRQELKLGKIIQGKNKQIFCFNFVEDNSAIVRVFPLENYYKLDSDNKMETYEFGIRYINEEDKFQMQEETN